MLYNGNTGGAFRHPPNRRETMTNIEQIWVLAVEIDEQTDTLVASASRNTVESEMEQHINERIQEAGTNTLQIQRDTTEIGTDVLIDDEVHYTIRPIEFK